MVRIASYISGGEDMRALPWIIAGVGIGVGVTILLFNESEPEYATGYGGGAKAARQTFGGGQKKRGGGEEGRVAVRRQEGVGKLTGGDATYGEDAGGRARGE